jgi:4-hydroxy-tetrahydrodipicolinate synthase
MTGRFGSVLTAMATPFRDDFSLDLDAAQDLARHLLDNGSDGLVITGSTGESATLSHREKVDLYRAIVEAVEGRGKVIAGTGTYNTAESVELTKEAQEAGVDGILAVTPYYNKPPQAGLIAHFSKIAESTDLPVLLYNIPGRTACTIEASTLLQLAAEVDNIVGVKDATADFQTIAAVVKESPPGFEVYSGDDWATFDITCLGGVGVISVAAHLVGDRMKEMIELIQAGDAAAARKIHQDLLPLYKALFITSNPIPLKAALGMVGRSVGSPRLPLVPATLDEKDHIERVLREVGVL